MQICSSGFLLICAADSSFLLCSFPQLPEKQSEYFFAGRLAAYANNVNERGNSTRVLPDLDVVFIGKLDQAGNALYVQFSVNIFAVRFNGIGA